MRSRLKCRVACGSLVLPNCCSFFRSASEKMNNKKKVKYHCNAQIWALRKSCQYNTGAHYLRLRGSMETMQSVEEHRYAKVSPILGAPVSPNTRSRTAS